MSTETSTGTGNSPTHIAYQVREGKNDKGHWTRIGVAWQHKDAKGFSVQLECLPIDGRISLRTANEKKD